MWDTAEAERPLARLGEQNAVWDVFLILERVAQDLWRGRISFRDDAGQRFDTAPVIVEESEAGVLRRGEELPASMLKQLLDSARERAGADQGG